MRRLSRRGRCIVSLVVFAFLLFYIEVVSYIVNSKGWSPTFRDSLDEAEAEEVVRVLLVADPQIIGENGEVPFLGLFTRWDADQFLRRNYRLAQYHVRPHVVVFLGDLFDEGVGATDPEFRRYTQRFSDIFALPRKQDPSPVHYIFLPGDNDIGGEGLEPVDPVKVRWFNQTFGDFRKELSVQRGSVNVQFLKMNLFIPEEYQDPTKGREHLVLNGGTLLTEFRILFSHTSLLQFRTNAVQTILGSLRPQVIFSAHSHHSTYTQLEDNIITQHARKFLFAHKHPSQQSKIWKIIKAKAEEEDIDGSETSEGLQKLQISASMSLSLDPDSRIVHEISVPTCSYRMGVPNMGFGAFTLYKNGTLEYTVLWLPSRLTQLYIYMGFYLILKLSLISWIIFRMLMFFVNRVRSIFDLQPGRIVKVRYHQV